MDENLTFLTSWNETGRYIAAALAAAGLLVILAYLIRLATLKEYKEKYDYMNKYEIKRLWQAAILFLISGTIYLNTLIRETSLLWFIAMIAVSIMIAVIVGVVIQNLLRFYYPFFLEKKLKRYRYKPRVSPNTGKPMKLLSEDEEDVYLDEGMQAEENVFSVDYDVWLDEETGYTKIEKYKGHLHAELSPECGYYTLRVVREEIVEEPTEYSEGRLIKHYECSYTGYKEAREFTIAKLSKAHKLTEKSTSTN